MNSLIEGHLSWRIACEKVRSAIADKQSEQELILPPSGGTAASEQRAGTDPCPRKQGAHHRMTDNRLTTLARLENVGPALDQEASILLGEVQALPDAARSPAPRRIRPPTACEQLGALLAYPWPCPGGPTTHDLSARPDPVLVTEAGIEVFQQFFGDRLDELFGFGG